MKQAILVFLCGFLICGCSRSSAPDNAKVEALSQKLDTVIQSQSAIEAKLDAADKMASYYYTNQIYAQLFYATNVINAVASDEQKSVNAINAETFRVAQIITTVIITNDSVIDMESDIEKIKVKLGAF